MKLIAYSYNTDKSQLYLNNYARHFSPYLDSDVRLFELGVHKGGSLLMWRDYFQRGNIVGLDLFPVKVNDETGRINVYQGDQRDLALLDHIHTECAPGGFDIVIDDASHVAEYTKASFWYIFNNHLKPGGLYVIEDWRVGYWREWVDGSKYEPNITSNAKSTWSPFHKANENKTLFPSHNHGLVGFVKQLMDELGVDAITNPERGGEAPQRFPKFQRIEICPGQVFVVKATQEDTDLVRQQLIGFPK